MRLTSLSKAWVSFGISRPLVLNASQSTATFESCRSLSCFDRLLGREGLEGAREADDGL